MSRLGAIPDPLVDGGPYPVRLEIHLHVGELMFR